MQFRLRSWSGSLCCVLPLLMAASGCQRSSQTEEKPSATAGSSSSIVAHSPDPRTGASEPPSAQAADQSSGTPKQVDLSGLLSAVAYDKSARGTRVVRITNAAPVGGVELRDVKFDVRMKWRMSTLKDNLKPGSRGGSRPTADGRAEWDTLLPQESRSVIVQDSSEVVDGLDAIELTGTVRRGDTSVRFTASLIPRPAEPIDVSLSAPKSPGRGEQLAVIDVGPKEDLEELAFSPDGKRFATVGFEGLVRVWNVESRQIEQTFDGDFSTADCVAFSHDGGLLAAGGYEGIVKIWNRQSGEIVDSVSFDFPLRVLEFHPDSRQLFILSGQIAQEPRLGVWDVDSRKLLWRYKDRDSIHAATFDCTPDSLLVAYTNGSVKTWTAGKGEIGESVFQVQVKEGGIPQIDQIVRSPRGDKMVLRLYNDMIIVMDPSDRTVVTQFTPPADVNDIAISLDERVVTAGQDRFVRAWDGTTGELLTEFHGHEASVDAVAISPDGTLLASAGNDHTIRLWKFGGATAKNSP